ncbi:TadE-like protein [Thioalkalivibrio nitratireducens DSM 14787]|uniref:TadE-like protein n=1 Tax=Thioalkalivibrio nitratireducens (strain DSM 14787 / UNIQEM 213 / ALEN2) TaxID=1255043 RepID=L0DYQ6_THIND|nr:TadE/TadG family type IV pilus assembly protein [Thioalkalivibrio nitratireducens]AGA34137.1 TadE-like protein [Thioalkalivibrio nitratireducens DSM 14787]
MQQQRGTGPRRGQRGAAGIEFALVFLLFFVIFYAVVSYALPMLLMQGLNMAAAEGARAAVAVDPAEEDYQLLVEQRARERVDEFLNWVPANAQERLQTDVRFNGAVLIVEVTYPDYRGNPLVPVLTLPLFGDVPRLPDDLTAAASIQL